MLHLFEVVYDFVPDFVLEHLLARLLLSFQHLWTMLLSKLL
jgi:hypothetical protein